MPGDTVFTPSDGTFVWKPGKEETAAGLPLARIGGLEDAARAVQWLVSDAEEWVTGTDLRVDGGTRGSCRTRRSGSRARTCW